jgi:hypothetical protein
MTTPEIPVDSELNFEWPEVPRRQARDMSSLEWRPLARRPTNHRPPEDWCDVGELRRQLDEAKALIARIEADRHAARVRIDELEAAGEILQSRVTAQRRRLLLLERQLEGMDVEPARDAGSRTSWLDRLFGGVSSVPTA